MEGETDLREPRTGATARAFQAAVALYTRWEAEQERSPLDRVVQSVFRSRRDLNARERRWIAEAVYGSVRFLRRQTFLLQRLGRPETPEERLRLWREQETEFDSALLPGPEAPQEYLRITLSYPDALASELETLLGEEALTAAEALNRQAPTTLRINPLCATRAYVGSLLPQTTPTRWSPWGLELPHRVNVYDLPGFREGLFEVQEEASQLMALLAAPEPGQTVAEVGAGAGGKTLALAGLMQNQGRLVAIDTSPERLEELAKRTKRAGVSCVEALPLSADTEGTWQPGGKAGRTLQRLYNAVDSALIDAPCTGSGVLRRSPDAKWRAFDLQGIHRLQSKLLAQASALVKPGGTLLYVTCAFERSQNEAIVEAFLDSEYGRLFAVEPIVPRLSAAYARALRERTKKRRGESAPRSEAERAPEPDWEALTSGPYLRTWPHRQGLDAFFAACLRRPR